MSDINSQYSEILESGLFSAAWYLERYPDVATAGADPLEHYLSYGASEGRDPGPDFSTSGYLARYSDVAETVMNPLLHYLRYGRSEGRLATPCLEPHLIKRPYRNFGEYLSHSALDPLIKAPFAEVDYCCFAIMEKLAGLLCRKTRECAHPPLVSVIMPMRDRAAVVGDAIFSVLGQSYENFELIVVDDGSRDESVCVARSFADPRIRLLECADSLGVSAARNLGLKAAKGDLIAYLDSDNEWLPDYLCAMTGAFQALPDADAVFSGQYLYQGGEGEPFAVRFGSYNQALLQNNNYIDLNCFVHRHDVLTAAGGGFCEGIRRWVDWELVLRFSRTGKIYSVPILQSDYFFDKADNTITAREELDPARAYIMAKHGYRHPGTEGCDAELIKKVSVIVHAQKCVEKGIACIDSLTELAPNPLARILVLADFSGPEAANLLRRLEDAGVNTISIDCGASLSHAVNEAMCVADPESDILIVDPCSVFAPDALSVLQQAAYADDSISITAPRQVLDKGNPAINTHVPYAFSDAPCDVTLSSYHGNIESLPLFNNGGPVDLNFVSFFCVYIKRDAWEMCGGLDARYGDRQAERVMCEFVRYVLGKRIVYTPAAIVLHRPETGA
jgi:GT2 family glycosyltransferase